MSNATANGGPTAAIVPVESKLDEMVARLVEELDEVKARRDLLRAELKDTERLAERIETAVRALSGPHQSPGRPKTGGKPNTKVSEDLLQVVEATLAREEPISIPALANEMPARHESSVRAAVYLLRDQGRVRLVDQKGERQSARYGLMPEVKAEHAS